MLLRRYFYVLAILSLMLNCGGGELPLLELSQAKEDISRAKKLGAAEYAPMELSEAEKSLLLAHEAASQEKVSDSKKNADYSIQKSLDALEKSAGKASARARELATEALDQADEAYATALATEEFDQAVQLRKDGDVQAETGDKILGESYKESSDDTKKNALRRSSILAYENSFDTYTKARSLADKSKQIALSRRDEIKDSSRDIEEDLLTAETYSEGNDPRIDEERTKLATAFQNIDQGKTKIGAMQLEDSRRSVKLLLAESIANYARKRNDTATDKVNQANEVFSEMDPADLSGSEELLQQYEAIREILGASNEALASSGHLYTQEKFFDSIQQSDEAIRFAESVLEQTLALKDAQSSGRFAKRSMNGSSSGESEANGEWKTYTVQRKKPADTLWRIAGKKEHLGNPRLWPRVYEANRDKIKKPSLIYPNQVLKIPPKKGNTSNSSHSTEPKSSTTKQAVVPKPAKLSPVEPILQPPLEEAEDSDNSNRSQPNTSEPDATLDEEGAGTEGEEY